jgi:hypothetical protein
MTKYIVKTDEIDPYYLHVSDSIEGAMWYVEKMLHAVCRISLMSILNDLQQECGGDDENSPFHNKFTIPLSIVNLVLKEYHIKIVTVEHA